MASTTQAPTKQMIDKSISTTHVEYDANLDKWTRCRDVIAGSDDVKDKGQLYLPKLSGQDEAAYKAYKQRATFYGAVDRTIRGMSGMVFMKDPTIEGLPDKYKDLLNDITFTGIPLAGFAKSVFKEVIGIGRAGVLVDMPKVGTEEQRPYMIYYGAEQILNWREERHNGKMVTELIVLQETYNEVDEGDIFTYDIYDQYRVLQLEYFDPVTGAAYPTPRYVVRVYRTEENPDNKQQSGYYLYEEVYPQKAGQPLDFIPFIPVGPEENTWPVQKSPILDMVEVVLSHYRTSADLENGRHWCGVPQHYMAGFPEKNTWQLGGDQIWQSSDPNAKAEFLEFHGTGLAALERALDEKESKLAVLGMRLLETQKKGAEQPEALRLRLLGDKSTLEGVVTTVSQAITQALKWAVTWIDPGTNVDDLVVALNKDFDDTTLNAQDLQSLVTLWQSDGISYKTLYRNLQKGEITRDGIDSDAELKDIQTEKENEDINGTKNLNNGPLNNRGGQQDIPPMVEGDEGDTGDEGQTE